MQILDRYVLRNFLEPFLLCFFGFIAIWLVFDVQDNITEFLSAKASLKAVGYYYLSQLPQIILIAVPVALLLALLFALSRMSRFNEIISMLTAGRSVGRMLRPLILVGIALGGLLLWLNYELAPRAEALKKVALEQISRGRKQGEAEAIDGFLFRDRTNNRTWYIRRMRPGQLQFGGVHITQQDENGVLRKRWLAGGAIYDARTKKWTLNKGIAVEFDEKGEVVKIDNFENEYRRMDGWTETPARIFSSRSEAQHLTVPELKDYLENNADFPQVQLAPFQTYLWHRLAVPVQCFILVFIAGPLAIVYSRRGVVGGVAAAMALYVGLYLSTSFFLALGKGGRLSPELAAWVPNAVFFVIGLILLWFRSSNRDLPSLLPRRR